MQKSIFGKMIKKVLLYSLIIFYLALSINAIAQETFEKDTDLDGIPDKIEVTKFLTDPNLPDTDNDGVLDSQEILDGTNPNNSSSNMEALLEYKAAHLPIRWYIARIAGIASFIMFTLVICMGLMMTSKFLLKYRIIPSHGALEIHTFNATFVAFLLLLIHIAAFMFDGIIAMELKEILIPFLFKRELTSGLGYNISIPVALGIIAFYLAIVLLVTSHLRNKLIPAKIWRMIHYSSFLFYLLFLFHAYFGGTDSEELWMQIIYLTSVTMVLSLLALRIFGKKYFIPKPLQKTVESEVNLENPQTASSTL